MARLINAGGRVLVRSVAAQAPRPSDVVMLVVWSGATPLYTVHRLLGRFRRGSERRALTKGDASFLPDGLRPERDITGLVLAVGKGERWLTLRRGGFRALLAALTAPP